MASTVNNAVVGRGGYRTGNSGGTAVAAGHKKWRAALSYRTPSALLKLHYQCITPARNGIYTVVPFSNLLSLYASCTKLSTLWAGIFSPLANRAMMLAVRRYMALRCSKGKSRSQLM